MCARSGAPARLSILARTQKHPPVAAARRNFESEGSQDKKQQKQDTIDGNCLTIFSQRITFCDNNLANVANRSVLVLLLLKSF